MNKRVFIYISVGVVVVLLLVGIRFASKAHNNLVTLNVRDADIKEVLREIQWQTFEVIYKNKDVNGKITLDVKDMPLENVLQIVAEQSSSRFNVVYPLYSNSESLLRLKKLLRGEIPIEKAGWTNYSARQLPLGGPILLPTDKIPVIYDYENWHPSTATNIKNVVFADIHIGVL